mmetsp:Transcript_5043/g.9328  ORF Transcript_5043/g.9328 Transcript_5043/m.9328 type:complete len:339 (+) Transcript_5043:179-1195(+)
MLRKSHSATWAFSVPGFHGSFQALVAEYVAAFRNDDALTPFAADITVEQLRHRIRLFLEVGHFRLHTILCCCDCIFDYRGSGGRGCGQLVPGLFQLGQKVRPILLKPLAFGLGSNGLLRRRLELTLQGRPQSPRALHLRRQGLRRQLRRLGLRRRHIRTHRGGVLGDSRRFQCLGRHVQFAHRSLTKDTRFQGLRFGSLHLTAHGGDRGFQEHVLLRQLEFRSEIAGSDFILLGDETQQSPVLSLQTFESFSRVFDFRDVQLAFFLGRRQGLLRRRQRRLRRRHVLTHRIQLHLRRSQRRLLHRFLGLEILDPKGQCTTMENQIQVLDSRPQRRVFEN